MTSRPRLTTSILPPRQDNLGTGSAGFHRICVSESDTGLSTPDSQSLTDRQALLDLLIRVFLCDLPSESGDKSSEMLFLAMEGPA